MDSEMVRLGAVLSFAFDLQADGTALLPHLPGILVFHALHSASRLTCLAKLWPLDWPTRFQNRNAMTVPGHRCFDYWRL